MLDAAIEVGPQPFNRPCQFKVAHAADDLLEHNPHLEPREARSDAEVATMTESHMRVGRASDVEAPGIGKDFLVAIGAHLMPADFGVAPCSAHRVGRGRGPAASPRERIPSARDCRATWRTPRDS